MNPEQAESIVKWADRVGTRTVIEKRLGLAVTHARRVIKGDTRPPTKQAAFQIGSALKYARTETP